MKLNPGEVARVDQRIAQVNDQLDHLIRLYGTTAGKDLAERSARLMSALTRPPLGAETDPEIHIRSVASLLTVAINRLSETK